MTTSRHGFRPPCGLPFGGKERRSSASRCVAAHRIGAAAGPSASGRFRSPLRSRNGGEQAAPCCPGHGRRRCSPKASWCAHLLRTSRSSLTMLRSAAQGFGEDGVPLVPHARPARLCVSRWSLSGSCLPFPRSGGCPSRATSSHLSPWTALEFPLDKGSQALVQQVEGFADSFPVGDCH